MRGINIPPGKPRLDLTDLSHIQLNCMIYYLTWLLIRQVWEKLPFPVRLALLQSGYIFLVIVFLPPSNRLPHIIVPIIYGAAFCSAFTTLQISRSLHALYRI